MDRIGIHDLTIQGYVSGDHHGIFIDRDTTGITYNDQYLSEIPDACDHISNVSIVGVDGCGIKAVGQNLRGMIIDRVQVTGCGNISSRSGIYLEGTDHHLSNIDIGTQGTNTAATDNHGFEMVTGDTILTNCRAWLNGGDGFKLSGKGAQLSNCSSHTNALSGFRLNNFAQVCTGCKAYDNQAASVANTAGFNFTSSAGGMAIGCVVYNELDPNQDYGFRINSGVNNVWIEGMETPTKEMNTGVVSVSGTAGTALHIRVLQGNGTMYTTDPA